MEVKNCKGCNRLFQYIGGAPLCPACKEALEDKFAQVKEYIYQNPGTSIAQVAEANDVSVKQIKQWIREDRLVLSEPTEDGIVCEQCGVPICSGRYCEKCKTKIATELGSVLNRPSSPSSTSGSNRRTEKTGNKMRFLS